jgi:hypothetical protein
MRARLIWTPEMIAALKAERRKGTPLLLCSEKIGVAYVQTVEKARELGIAGRLNRGPVPGAKVVRRLARCTTD